MNIKLEENKISFVQHPGQGFFSCCTIHLCGILYYFNYFKKIPRIIDSTKQFLWYKPIDKMDQDIKNLYFKENQEIDISYSKDVYMINHVKNHDMQEQYYDYKTINYKEITPFINKYFQPSDKIQNIKNQIIEKYNLDISNICVLFYRGNDKIAETQLPRYDQYIDCAMKIKEENPGIRFLIQTDETEFIENMSMAFPNNHIILYDEIRHIRKNNNTTVDKVYNYKNPIMSQYFLAITYIMSKCKYVICGSGNCSLWIALFRGNCDNFIQFCYKTP